ncbi:MAG: hypothetical protein WCX31_13305 [Salinivirgaceae bacterium]
MKSLKKETKGILVSILIAFIFLSFFYPSYLFHPNKYLFSAENDGLKTYYNFIYHGKHDSSVFSFQGMSHPYGEFLLFEDSLPILNIANQAVARIWPGVSDYSVGIINLLILLSYVVGAVFLTLIFIRLTLPFIAAAFAGNAIIFLSSQVLLINPAGHFGLAFVCFFPMGWYLVIKQFDHPTENKWPIIIALTIIFWTFIHVYLGFILLFFIVSVNLFIACFDWKNYWKNSSRITYLVVQLIVPISVIAILYLSNDPHPNRIDMPFITDHRASFHSVFLPNHSLTKPIYNAVFNTGIQNEQRWGQIGNYIGMVSNAALVIFLFMSGYYLLKKKNSTLKTLFPIQIQAFAFAAVLLLLFSMAIPLKYLPNHLINSIPLIKQFSALGRFAWGFYYVIATLSIYYFFKLVYHLKGGKLVFTFLICLIYFEAIPSHLLVSKNCKKSPNAFNQKYIAKEQLNITQIDTQLFQAILPIPTYFKFNLPFGSSNSDRSIYGSLVSSAHTGLPILSTYLSRPSVSESLDIYKMFIQWPYNRVIQPLVDNGKDIAVIVHGTDLEVLSVQEKEIISKCTLLSGEGEYLIYKLPIAQLIESNNEVNYQHFSKLYPELINNGELLVNDTNDFVFYQGYDDLVSGIAYRGKGALKGKKEQYTLVGSISTAKMDTSCNYIISFWYYNHVWDQTFTTAIITETDSLNQTIQYLYYSPIETSIIDGWWYYSEHTVKIKSNKNTLSIFIKGEAKFEDWIAVDDLMIFPTKKEIFQVKIENDSTFIYRNNLLFAQMRATLLNNSEGK